MNIAIVGGGGFLGKALASQLVLVGHTVRIVDIANDPRRVPGGASYVQADITNYEQVSSALKNAEAVYDLAGTVLNTARKNPRLAVALDGVGIGNVLEACVSNKIQKILYASSFYVYDGIPAERSVSEEEKPDIFSAEMFGVVKALGERLVREYTRTKILKSVILRLGPMYGADERCTAVIYDFLKSGLSGNSILVWGKGDRKNQYTFVKDAASAMSKCLEKENETYNIISPEQTSLRQVAEMMSRDFGFRVEYDLTKKEGPSLPYIFATKAQNELQWNSTRLREGVKQVASELQGQMSSIKAPK